MPGPTDSTDNEAMLGLADSAGTGAMLGPTDLTDNEAMLGPTDSTERCCGVVSASGAVRCLVLFLECYMDFLLLH